MAVRKGSDTRQTLGMVNSTQLQTKNVLRVVKPFHYARCLEASFQGIYRCQKGIPTVQNINSVVISFLIVVMMCVFSLYFVKYMKKYKNLSHFGV